MDKVQMNSPDVNFKRKKTHPHLFASVKPLMFLNNIITDTIQLLF